MYQALKETGGYRIWVCVLVLSASSSMQPVSALGKPSAVIPQDGPPAAPVEIQKPNAPGSVVQVRSVVRAKVGHFLINQRPFQNDVVLKINASAIAWMLVGLGILMVGSLVYVLGPTSAKTTDISPRIPGPVDAWAYVGCSPPHVYGVCEPGRTDVLLPSGIWRGYSQEDGKDFEVIEFVLDFTSTGENQPGQVTGSGTDDTGKYSLAGVFEQRRVAFQKKYIWGTPALDGRVNHEINAGHVVEYRAEWAGENLRKGIKGMWYIEELTGSTRSNGKFHVWPAMDGWQRIGQKPMAPMYSSPDVTNFRTTGMEGLSETPRKILAFKVEQDQICAKCYENPINVCLLPCGHTAICKSCESGLRHRLCPICYAPVNMIVTENGTVLKSRQNTQKPPSSTSSSV